MPAKPNSIDAERSVLGSVLCDGAAIVKVAGQLRADHFYDTVNGMIYSAMLEQYGRHEPIDLVTLSNELKAVGRYEDVGGAHYLTGLMQVVPSSSNVKRYADIVIEKYRYRATSEEAAKLALEAEREAEECFERIAKLNNVAFSHEHKSRAISDIFNEACEWIETKRNWPITGFYDLDKMIDLEPGSVWIIGARPSMGKTALAVNIFSDITLRQGRDAMFFSLEMSAAQIVRRIIASELKLPTWLLRDGKLRDSKDWMRIMNFGAKLIASNQLIDDSMWLTAFDIEAQIREARVTRKIEVVFIDYLGLLLSSKDFENRNAELSYISRTIKAMAKDMNVCVVAMAQLNRGGELRKDKRPQLSDLRDSGAIEQDADGVMFPFRPAYYEETQKNEFDAEINIAKNRLNGSTGTVHLWWRKDYGRFENPEKPEQQAKGW